MIRANIYFAFDYLHQKKIVDRLRFSALLFAFPKENVALCFSSNMHRNSATFGKNLNFLKSFRLLVFQVENDRCLTSKFALLYKENWNTCVPSLVCLFHIDLFKAYFCK
jgi:hypothetical protein